MKIKDIELGKRVYHFAFGWCKIDAPMAVGENGKERILVDLEADKIEYYVMGHGRKSFQRNLKTGKHTLLCPVSELFLTDNLPKENTLALQLLALSPKITFWNDKNKLQKDLDDDITGLGVQFPTY